MRWTHSGDWLWSLARAGKNGAGIIYVAGEIIHFEAGSSALARGQDASDDSGRCDDTVGSAGAGGSIFLRADKLYLDRSDQYSHFNARGGRGLHRISQNNVLMPDAGNGRIRVDFKIVRPLSLAMIMFPILMMHYHRVLPLERALARPTCARAAADHDMAANARLPDHDFPCAHACDCPAPLFPAPPARNKQIRTCFACRSTMRRLIRATPKAWPQPWASTSASRASRCRHTCT